MSKNLFIPQRIKIGFNNRTDTFTGKLGYVIYYDEKNVLRKEKSWNSWRNDKIEPIEFDNKPQAGFLFNKGVNRHHDWYSSGRSMIRVYDPRDFEFEISVDNLIGILMHSDISKRDIIEPCVFAWAGTELVLLPINSEDYQRSLEYTSKQYTNISTKDLVPGKQYQARKSDQTYTYIGHYPYYGYESRGGDYLHKRKGKKHIFYDGKGFVVINPTTLSSILSDDINPDIPNLTDKWFTTVNSQPIKKYFIDQSDIPCGKFVKQLDDCTFKVVQMPSTGYGSLIDLDRTFVRITEYTFDYKNQILRQTQTMVSHTYTGYSPYYSRDLKKDESFYNQLINYGTTFNKEQFAEAMNKMGFYKLFVELENGYQLQIKL